MRKIKTMGVEGALKRRFGMLYTSLPREHKQALCLRLRQIVDTAGMRGDDATALMRDSADGVCGSELRRYAAAIMRGDRPCACCQR